MKHADVRGDGPFRFSLDEEYCSVRLKQSTVCNRCGHRGTHVAMVCATEELLKDLG